MHHHIALALEIDDLRLVKFEASLQPPVRRFIDGGMTAGIGDPDVLARTITVYTDVAAFQRLLATPSSNDVHALVVDRDGAILGRGCGDPDDESWAAIAAGLASGRQ